SETEQTSNESESAGYALLPAIKEEKPVEESPALVESPVDDAVKDVANDVVMDDEAAVINNSSVESAEPTPVAPVAVIPLAPKVQDITNTASIGQARQAFWARDLVKAEYMYREFLKREPTAADAWGELGNIYYGQAKWQQAAEAYAEAAIQLLEQGQYSQAMFLHYVVRGLDPVQSARIDAKLRAMQTTPQG
ncbi:MAG: hypothetical protein HKM22_04925, partial [Gammaproteobacteria bacterium]|nr:hypothetical protein [Gammaproteobacteria bacterium]